MAESINPEKRDQTIVEKAKAILKKKLRKKEKGEIIEK